MSKFISVLVPVYNEAEVLGEFHKQLVAVLSETGYGYEILYVDDGSTDSSLELLASIRADDRAVAVIELSRNFGKEVALSAGLDHARGDAVVLIDADLQDPPELINRFLEEWGQGYDVVYGSRVAREGEPWLKRVTAAGFYRLLNMVSDVEIPENAGDFRLLSRRAVDALVSLPERHRYMKGLYAWIGFPQKSVPFVRQPRFAGESHWSYWRLWNFALEGITSFSTVPLKFATYLGGATSLVAILYGGWLGLRALFGEHSAPGAPPLIVAMLFLGGVQLICLGIIGEYMARTFQETKGRALYFVKGYHPARVQDVSPEIH